MFLKRKSANIGKNLIFTALKHTSVKTGKTVKHEDVKQKNVSEAISVETINEIRNTTKKTKKTEETNN